MGRWERLLALAQVLLVNKQAFICSNKHLKTTMIFIYILILIQLFWQKFSLDFVHALQVIHVVVDAFVTFDFAIHVQNVEFIRNLSCAQALSVESFQQLWMLQQIHEDFSGIKDCFPFDKIVFGWLKT